MGDAALGQMLRVPAVQGQHRSADMGSCLMKIIVWIALEIKTHSVCQLVQVHTCCARAPQCHSCQPAFKCEGYFGANGFPFVL